MTDRRNPAFCRNEPREGGRNSCNRRRWNVGAASWHVFILYLPISGGYAYVILPVAYLKSIISLFLIVSNCAIFSCLFLSRFPSLYHWQEKLIPGDFLWDMIIYSNYNLMNSRGFLPDLSSFLFICKYSSLVFGCFSLGCF